jgi:hypothetical protein
MVLSNLIVSLSTKTKTHHYLMVHFLANSTLETSSWWLSVKCRLISDAEEMPTLKYWMMAQFQLNMWFIGSRAGRKS